MNKVHSCKFAEDLVSYLYGELVETDKEQFETHLNDCQNCMAELDDLSLAHSSVAEFKAFEFDHLPTPMIEIEYTPKKVAVSSASEIEANPVSKSWFAGVRDIFTLSPSWATAATAFGVLAIVLGIFYFAVNYGNKQQLADDKNQIAPTVPPVIEKKNNITPLEPEKDLVVQNNNSKPTPTPPVNPEPPDNNTGEADAGSVKPIRTNLSPVRKGSPATRAPSKGVKPVTPIKPPKVQPKKKELTVPDSDDEEDDTLRLADMFEELTASVK